MTKTNTDKFNQHVDIPLNVANISTAANLATVGNVVNVTRNNLLNSFNPDNFIVDQNFVTNVEKVAGNIVTRETDFRNQKQLLSDEHANNLIILATLAAKGPPTVPPAPPGRSPAEEIEWTRIPTRQLEITNLIARLDTLLLPANRPQRQIEYQDMAQKVREFNLTATIPDMTSDTLTVYPDLMIPGKDANEYGFFDNQGRRLALPINLDIILTDGTVKNVIISGLTYIAPPAAPKAPGTLDVSAITLVDSRTGLPLIPAQGYQFSINIGAIINLAGAPIVPLVNMKPLKVMRPKPGTLNGSQERTRYDIFNMGGKPINEYIQDFYDNTYKEVEDKLLDETIGDAATDENKKVLRERIKKLIAGGREVSPFVKNQIQINKNFKEHFFANTKPTADDISTTSKFNDFLKKTIPNHLKTYVDQELKRQMESTEIKPVGTVAPYLPATRKLHDVITKEILKYRQEQEDHGRDDFTEQAALSSSIAPNKKRRSPSLTRPRLLGKKDVSYMRFFTNQTQEIGKQQMKLVTDENKNKVEFVGYDATLKVGSVDNLTMEIKMDNGEEIPLKAGNHIALIDSILKQPGIPYGKMRIHMAYNMIKAMIKMANKNNVTLEYAVGNIIHTISVDKNDDIILETVDDTTGKRSRNNLFSEKKFDAENDMHQLREGLEGCLGQFNKSMEKVHDQYKEATDKKLFGYFSLSRAKFPVGRFDSPIKKLMNIRKNRTLNFDFPNIKIEGIDKNISISFSKNTFTITSDLLKKPVTSKNLGTLLNTRIDGKRIFDGMERAISGTVYQSMIGNLRKNVKLANTNFGVKDPVKNRIYFLDKAGEVGYISLANNKNPIAKSITRMFKHEYGTIKRLPSTGRMMLTKEQAQKELYQNPFIMGKLMKAMNQRLYSF